MHDRASACMSFLKFGEFRGTQVSLDLAALSANTRKRAKAFKDYDNSLNGTTWSPSDYKESCDA